MVDIREIGAVFAASEDVPLAVPTDFGADITVVAADFKIVRREGHFEVAGACKTTLKAACSLCLADVAYPLAFEFSEKYSENANSDNDDIGISDGKIDIRAAIMRNLLLNLPMKLLCTADCAGLCPKCGADLNLGQCECKEEVNEHFRQLLQLFDDEEV